MSIVDPVRCKQTTESSHKDKAAIVFDCFCQFSDLVRSMTEPEIVPVGEPMSVLLSKRRILAIKISYIRNLTPDPATAMLPSRAYTGLPSKLYATVARSPWVDITGFSPTLYNRKQPVP